MSGRLVREITSEIADAVEDIADLKSQQRWSVDYQDQKALAAEIMKHKIKLQAALTELTGYRTQVKR